jgi:2-(1,2-epoxy-1,2-dihydrophenyl)acetyl-CoA isomerase
MSEILSEVKDQTGWITLNRPKSSNALSSTMIGELIKALENFDYDTSIRSIVITGAGKNFCAGGDIVDMKNQAGMFAGEPNELRERYKKGIQKIPLCFQHLSTPVIAMVNGAAIGAGLDLACMCNIRIASDNAKFGETFAKLGLVPGDGGSFFLQRVVGYSKAMELSLTAEIITANEALKIKLINKLVGAGELLSLTKEMLNKINSNAPIAIQMVKRSIIHASKNDLNSSLELLSAFQGIAQRTSDHLNSVENVLEKNKTDFLYR